MHTYSIQRKVSAVTHTWDTKEFLGYKFEPCDQSMRGGFLVSKIIEAETWNAALADFLKNLEPVLDCICIVTQSMINHGPSGSYLVYRLDNNKKGAFIAYVAKYGNTVGMDFDLSGWKDIEKLMASDNKDFLSLLRESNAGYTPRQRLTILLMAIESFAGSKKETTTCECGRQHNFSVVDRTKVELLLGASLSKKVFGSGGIRHRFLHGVMLDEQEVAALVNEIYNKIVLEYLVTTYKLESLQPISSAPRAWRIDVWHSFLESKVGMPQLLDVIENHDNAEHYQIISKVADY